jgi:hypothetical protein
MTPITRSAAVCAALLVALLAPALAEPCSICRCGDPTFSALGRDGFAAQGFRFALDVERFDKTEGDPAAASEAQVENRLTLLGSYGFNDRLTLLARVPFSVRRLDASSADAPLERVRSHGLSDPELHVQAQLWASRLRGQLGRRASLTLDAGVKTAWGENELTRGGQRLDEHAQPGTGASDVFGGLAFLYLIDRRSALFASAAYRHTGRNDLGHRYGSAALANLTYEHKLGARFDAVVELNFRHAARDEVDALGTHLRDPDTGGALLYLTPRLLVDLGRGVVLRAAVQVPTARHLNGFQRERAVANVGLTYLFGSR